MLFAVHLGFAIMKRQFATTGELLCTTGEHVLNRWSGTSAQHLYISATHLRWFHKQEPKLAKPGKSPAKKLSLCVLYTFFF